MAARRAGSSARASSGEGDVTTGILAIRKRLELARGRRRRSVGAESGEGETSLKCAAALAFAFLSAPVDTPSCGSLGNNQLCGVDRYGNGTYTAEGITKLREALKGSTVTSLKCAAAPRACLSVNAH